MYTKSCGEILIALRHDVLQEVLRGLADLGRRLQALFHGDVGRELGVLGLPQARADLSGRQLRLRQEALASLLALGHQNNNNYKSDN